MSAHGWKIYAMLLKLGLGSVRETRDAIGLCDLCLVTLSGCRYSFLVCSAADVRTGPWSRRRTIIERRAPLSGTAPRSPFGHDWLPYLQTTCRAKSELCTIHGRDFEQSWTRYHHISTSYMLDGRRTLHRYRVVCATADFVSGFEQHNLRVGSDVFRWNSP